jgi:thioester reductase-like protein
MHTEAPELEAKPHRSLTPRTAHHSPHAAPRNPVCPVPAQGVYMDIARRTACACHRRTPACVPWEGEEERQREGGRGGGGDADSQMLTTLWPLRAPLWQATRLHRWTRVLLTGATGFLGSFLLCELLWSTRSYVYCLVRVSEVGGGGVAPAEACKSRLIKTLQSYGLYTEDIQKAMDERCGVLVGDAGLQNMGLDEDEYHYLSQHVDNVVHAAAVVNLLYPYEALAAGNVRGTSNVVSFCQSGKVKSMHYISSDAVFPIKGTGAPWSENNTLLEGWKDLHSGYGQSKWVAEQLVRQALDAGLPGAIYRCGNIAGHMTTGAWNGKDSNLSIIRACLLAQAVPLVEGLELTFEATPVDFIAKFIVSCSENVRVSTNKTFHLIQPNHLAMEDLLEAAKLTGYSNIKAVSSVDEWVNLVEIASAAAGVQPVTAETLLEICSLAGRVFSNDNVSAYLNKIRQWSYSEKDGFGMFLPPRYPMINATAMARYMKKLTGMWKLLPAPTGVDGEILSTKVLHMRVVVVAGAASDMGSAIALGLAQHGARVAAIDTDAAKLEQIARQAALSGGVVLPVVVDMQDTAAVRAELEKAEEELALAAWGLVNCCATMSLEKVVKGNAEAWCKMLDDNCRSVLNVTGALMESLTGGEGGRGGHIINITSKCTESTHEGLAAFGASKAFIESWSRGLRQELSPFGIRVTNIQLSDVKAELALLSAKGAINAPANGGLMLSPSRSPSLPPSPPPSSFVSDLASGLLHVLFLTCAVPSIAHPHACSLTPALRVVATATGGEHNNALSVTDIAEAVLYAMTSSQTISLTEITVTPGARK